MAKPIRIYLAAKPAPDRGKYEVYVDGDTTGIYVTVSTIRKILSREQYKDFVKGFEIFMVDSKKQLLNVLHNNNKDPERKRYIKGF